MGTLRESTLHLADIEHKTFIKQKWGPQSEPQAKRRKSEEEEKRELAFRYTISTGEKAAVMTKFAGKRAKRVMKKVVDQLDRMCLHPL